MSEKLEHGAESDFQLTRSLQEQNVHLQFAQEMLRKANEELELQVAERTAELAKASAMLHEQINERQRVEAALVAEHNLLQTLVDNLPDRIYVKDTESQFMLVNTAMIQYLGVTTPDQVVGKTDFDVQPPALAAQSYADEQAIMQSGQPLVNQEEASVNDATGARSWVLITKVPVRDAQGQIIGLVGMSRDITERKRVEQYLAMQFAVTRILSEAKTRHAAVPRLLQTICSGGEWDLGELWRVDADANLLRWEAAWHVPSLPAAAFVAASRTLTFPPGSGLPGQVWARGQPLRMLEVTADDTLLRTAQAGSAGLHDAFAFPICSGSTVLGVLVFFSRAPRPPDPELLTMLANLGSQVGQFFERMQAAERLRQYAQRLVNVQEAERTHIARELHDEIGQALALIKMNVRAVQRLAHPSELAPRLEQSLHIIEQTLQRVRTLALDLRPSMLDDLGLGAALRWYVQRQAEWAGLNAEVIAESLLSRIPRELETVCFRVAQEALTNVVRHAQASTVRVKLRQGEGGLHMLIQDDGIGFDVRRVHKRAAGGASAGLLGMQERVALAGGQVAIESRPGHGTTIRVWVPLVNGASIGEPEIPGGA
jgi:PAS domain S-box-containing protein